MGSTLGIGGALVLSAVTLGATAGAVRVAHLLLATTRLRYGALLVGCGGLIYPALAGYLAEEATRQLLVLAAMLVSGTGLVSMWVARLNLVLHRSKDD